MVSDSFEKISNDNNTGVEWDMSDTEFAGANGGDENEKNGESKEILESRDIAVLKDIFPKIPDEDEEVYNEFILHFHSLVPRDEGESDDDYHDRMMGIRNGEKQEIEEDGYKWEGFVKGTQEYEKLKKEDSLFLFLTSADDGFAVEKEKAVDTFIDKVENAASDKEFNQAKMLALAIQNDKAKFSDDEIKKMTEFMQTPAYQKKLFTSYIEQNKRAIEKKNSDLKRCLDEIEREKEGSFLKKLSNQKAIKEAEMRAQWVRNGIKEAEELLLYYSEKLKELEKNGSAIDADKLAEGLMAEKNKAA